MCLCIGFCRETGNGRRIETVKVLNKDREGESDLTRVVSSPREAGISNWGTLNHVVSSTLPAQLLSYANRLKYKSFFF